MSDSINLKAQLTRYCDLFFFLGCSKNFQKRDGMIRHIRAHVDIRPFECKICNQKFLQPVKKVSKLNLKFYTRRLKKVKAKGKDH